MHINNQCDKNKCWKCQFYDKKNKKCSKGHVETDFSKHNDFIVNDKYVMFGCRRK